MIDDIPTNIMDAARECHNRIMAQSEGVGLTEARAVYNIARTIMEQQSSARAQAWEQAAQFIDNRASDYVQEHGVTDPETGTVEFPGWGDEYVSELEELAEGIRARSSQPIADHSSDVSNMVAPATLPDDRQSVDVPDYEGFALAICQFAFDGGDADGGTIQEIGLKHRVLRAEEFDLDRHKSVLNAEYFEPGDLVYCFNFSNPLPASPVSDYVPLCSTKGYHLILDITVTEDEEPGCRVEFAGVIEDAEIDGFPFSCEGYCLRIETGNAAYIMLESATLNTLTALRTAYSSIVERDLVSEPLILGALAAQGIEPSSRVKITFKNGEYPQS